MKAIGRRGLILLLAAPGFFLRPDIATAVEVASDTPRLTVGTGLTFLNLQGPTLTRDERAQFGLTTTSGLAGATHLPLANHWRVEFHLLYAPDMQEKSGRVDIREDFTSLVPALAFTFPYLFRFSAALGPALIWSRTTYDILGSDESTNFYSLGLQARLGVEYAITNAWEFHLNFGYQYRDYKDRTDYYYGATVAFNIAKPQSKE